jgi:outer membrane protein OmpA-like peptidoglycan-associated protein
MPRHPRPTLRAPALALALALAACASPPPQALLDARAAYDEASANADVGQHASVELLEARRALERAEREWADSGDAAETGHLSYLAARRVEIANEWAAGRRAELDAQALRGERERVLLEVRTSEADRARALAETRALEADAARRELEAAMERERALRQELADLQARDTERGLVLTLGDVLFEVDQATLKPGAMQRLFRLVTFLRAEPTRGVLVEGHTDSTGSEAHNLALSERRAQAVQRFLVDNGIEASRVIARGYGLSMPIAPNDTPAGRQLNRRVEIVILDPGQRPQDHVR